RAAFPKDELVLAEPKLNKKNYQLIPKECKHLLAYFHFLSGLLNSLLLQWDKENPNRKEKAIKSFQLMYKHNGDFYLDLNILYAADINLYEIFPYLKEDNVKPINRIINQIKRNNDNKRGKDAKNLWTELYKKIEGYYFKVAQLAFNEIINTRDFDQTI